MNFEVKLILQKLLLFIQILLAKADVAPQWLIKTVYI